VLERFSHYGIFDSDSISLEIFKNFQISDHKLFVFSLSRVEDDLSQWRGYTGDTYGYSIQVNLNGFAECQKFINCGAISKQNCRIVIKDCIYFEDDKKRAVEGLLLTALMKFIKKERDWHRNLFFQLITLNIFFKNEKFASEKECRIAVLPEEIKFAGGKSLN
jgi:hypothetical protein